MTAFAGLDAGSVSVKAVVVDRDGRLLAAPYVRHAGRPLDAAGSMLAGLAGRFPDLRACVTGGSGKRVAQRAGLAHVGELAALAEGAHHLLPGASCLMELGGEDSKLLLLHNGRLRDFALNSVCAAGTGSFLDQQAERMGLAIQEFSELASQCQHPPRIAGRCSVFAKSDMIHLQQVGASVADIAAGLCFAVARSFQASVVRGRALPPPLALAGGVALNQGVVRAFREVFAAQDLTVPELPTHVAAAGAVRKAMADGLLRPVRDFGTGAPDPAHGHTACQADARARKPRLVQVPASLATREAATEQPAGPLYLGVDVGSISTNLVVLDRHANLLARRYLRTASRPIEAVKRGLAEIRKELEELNGLDEAAIAAAGVTGSGRYMIADLMGADVVKNEITAQATAALHLDPAVDTVFEIGGQDSKYISLSGGVIADFEMNKACAAGTGSFLEEQAERLNVDVKGQFAELALGATAPCGLGERCTVFMDNAVRARQAQGAQTPDLLAGLAHAIVDNYLGRVVGSRAIGRRVFFQGGTAHNQAVVAAFAAHPALAHAEFSVPPNHDVTGALGMALIAREHAKTTDRPSAFGGFRLPDHTLSSFACKGCDNLCEIHRVRVEGRAHSLAYGGRCEKWDEKPAGPAAKAPETPDAFALRRQALEAAHLVYKARHKAGHLHAPRGDMGLPRAFFAQDMLPYFSTLLWELGFCVRLSPPSGPAVTALGVTTADTCYPVKVAQGHVRWLANQGVATQFVPSVINLSRPRDAYPTSLACPLTQSFPYQVRAALPELTVVAPEMILRHGPDHWRERLLEAFAPFGVTSGQMKRAMRAAQAGQDSFESSLRRRGQQMLEQTHGRVFVLLGRAYNAFDNGLNLNIPAKLAGLGHACLPMDMLPASQDSGLDEVRRRWPRMYWRSGQRMLAAARLMARNPRLVPIVLGNFSCGPDSFIHKYLEEELDGRPALFLELDEHAADAGVVTRLEAFIDSLDGREPKAQAGLAQNLARPVKRTRARKATVHIPRMSDHSLAIGAAFRACGVRALVMEPSNARSLELARPHVSGKECYPCAVTTGDMLAAVTGPDFNPATDAVFMPSGTGPCRFGQYNVFHRMVLDRAGHAQVPLLSPDQSESMYKDAGVVGTAFARTAWDGIVAVDLLLKCLHETRPLEAEPGRAQAAYNEYLERVMSALSSGPTDIRPLLARARHAFESIPRTGQAKPLIGVLGEIFVRANAFSNEDLILAIERLGGRAWLAPCDEWISYVGEMSRARARRNRSWKPWAYLGLKSVVQARAAHRLEEVFKGFLATAPEPPVGRVLELAEPYVRPSFEGEAILSVGKGVHMCRSGAHGLVNAMPFGCMPGTIAGSLLAPVAKRFGVPLATLTFDGSPSPVTALTLETLVDQARAGMMAGV